MRLLTLVALFVVLVLPASAGARTHCWGDTIVAEVEYDQHGNVVRLLGQHAVYRGCDRSAKRRGLSQITTSPR